MLKRALRVLSWVWMTAWVGFSVLALVYVIAAHRSPDGPEFFGYRFLSVLTDSMAPAIHSGDLVIDRRPDPKTIAVGQVLTYRDNVQRRLVTHRVVQKTQLYSEPALMLKGDNNNLIDDMPVLYRDIVGVYSVRVPFAGYAIYYARTWIGFVVLVVIPGIWLLLAESLYLHRTHREERQHQALAD